VVPSNEKLRARAVRLVAMLTRASAGRAAEALEKSGNRVRRAVEWLGG
jgi:N-acetylmuramic acid 6-phosphate (MurNAc-6-P) etherase